MSFVEHMFDNGGMSDDANRTYLAIDLKSFYASAECAARDLDPLTTNLVVADTSRTEKTICLAVSPSLKAYGLPGRARLFEVVETLNRINEERRLRAPGRKFVGASSNAIELAHAPQLKIDYIAAKPRMAYYLKVSGQIYSIYLRYAAPEDIHVYSIDEVFIDATRYLKLYHVTAHELARLIVQNIIAETGITATAGIGSNMYLAKIAMDIVAKHMPADRDGVRVAELDETSYRRLLWNHRPLTDFWRVGRGYVRRLESAGLLTMGDIARCSLGRANDYYNEELLYRMFGVNAELLIDHAWGWEPCNIADIKAYQPADHSLSSGQVLHQPYSWASARLVVREMADAISLELVDKGLVAGQIGLYVGYEGVEGFEGSFPTSTNRFGKRVPRPANGSADLGEYTSSTKIITDAMVRLYDRIIDRAMRVRRITVVVSRLRPYTHTTNDLTVAHDVPSVKHSMRGEQLDLFSTIEDEPSHTVSSNALYQCNEADTAQLREHDMQQTLLAVKRRFGKNAVFKGMNLEPDATGRDRNNQIGGHAAGYDDTKTAQKPDHADYKDQREQQSSKTSSSSPAYRGSGDNHDFQKATDHRDSQSSPALPTSVSALQTTHRYDDIIDMPHHISRFHPPMSHHNRAAQFMPFAALTGYDQVLLDALTQFEQAYATTPPSSQDALNSIC